VKSEFRILKSRERMLFDDELMASIRRPTYGRRHRGMAAGLLVLTVGIVGGLIYGAIHFRFKPPRARQHETLSVMGCAVVEALCTNDMAPLSIFCADGESGAALLREDDDRIFIPGQPVATSDFSRVPCLEFLVAMHADMAEQGFLWERIRPLAFGGVQANVFDPGTMRKAAVSVTGSIYFSAGSAVYALDVTARRCDDRYVIVDFWKCGAVEVSPANIERYSLEQYNRFLGELDSDPIKITHSKHVYLSIEESV